MARENVPHALGAKERVRARTRAHYEGWFPDTMAIYRPTRERVRGFGNDVEYVLLDIWPANHWAVGGREALVAQRLDVKAEVMVSGPSEMDLTALDQIVYTITKTGAVHHYEITWVRYGSRQLTLDAMCIEYPLAPGQVANM